MAIIEEQIQLTETDKGKRLDAALAKNLPQYSRNQLKDWIINNKITVNNNIINQPRYKIIGNEIIDIKTELIDKNQWQAEKNILLDIIFEDEELLIINKPVGLIVHPGAGNYQHTLANALLGKYPELSKLERAGLVHRIDKDTSGLLVIAKTITAQHNLKQQIANKTAKREYVALVQGNMIISGKVEAGIRRHPIYRQRMQVSDHIQARPALTYYQIKKRFDNFTLLNIQLSTGRTHQIRVHMEHLGYPIFGDPVYNKHKKFPANLNEEHRKYLINFKRQALHAAKLTLYHPQTNKIITAKAEIPDDMHKLIDIIDSL